MNTKALRQKILDLAIRGKLVPQNPNDEPASALLQRIRVEKQRLIREGKIKRPKKSAPSDTPHYQNVPFEVPDNWEWCRLDEVSEIARGGSPRPIKDFLTTDKSGINWIKIGDADSDGKYISSTKEKIIEAGIKKSRLVHKGDFLLTNSMSFGHPYILNIDGCIHDGWLVISPANHTYERDFLYYLLSSSFAYSQFSDAASGGVVSNLNTDKVSATLYPLPPYAEQRRIVAEIEKWFGWIDKIEENQADLATLVEQAKGKILDLAIHGKLVAQDESDEPALNLLHRINPDFQPSDTSRYENLPSGWQVTELGRLCQLNNGEKETGRRIYLDAKYLRGKADGTFLTEGNLVAKGDYVILVDGENSGEVFVAPQDGYMGSTFKRLIMADGMYCPYVLFFIMFYKKTLRNSKKGAAIPHLNKDLFRSLEIGVPPYAEQQRIVAKIERLFAALDDISQSLL